MIELVKNPKYDFMSVKNYAFAFSAVLILLGIGGTLIFGTLAHRQGARLLTRAVLLRPVLIRNAAEMCGTMTFVTAISISPLSKTRVLIAVRESVRVPMPTPWM